MKRKKLFAVLTALLVAGAVTATAVPVAIYALNPDKDVNTIAVNNEIGKTDIQGRSLYFGVSKKTDIQTSILDKLGYKDDASVKPSDVSVKLLATLTEDEKAPDTYIEDKTDVADFVILKDDTISFQEKGLYTAEVTVKDTVIPVIFDVDEEIFADVDLNDYAVENSTKNPNFLSDVTFDEETVKDVTIADSDVNVKKDGDYLLTYEITDVNDKEYDKSVIVTVADKNTVTDLEEDGVWVAKQNVVAATPSDKTDKDSNPTPVISGNEVTDSSRPATKPSHSDSNQASDNNQADHTHSYVTVVTKEATCTEEGEKIIKCETCGEVFKTEAIAPKGHHWATKVVTKEATCTEEGTAEYTCDACGEKKTESIAAIGHDVIETVITEPTCAEAGSKELTCSRCDYKEIVEIPATGEHTWDEGVVTTEPTCGAEGEKTYTCTVCEEQKTEAIAKLEHAYGEWEVVKAPTCTVYGSEARICANCGRAEMRIVDALGHDLQEEVITPATCGEAGEKKVTCSRCDYEEIVKIPATGEHTYGEWEVVTPATCGEAGLEKAVCTVCGHEETREIPATGEHTWDAGVVTKEPTCTEKGERTYNCTICSETKVENIDMIAHSYGNWVTTKEPTCAAGEEQRTCSVCGHVETREIPATGTHTFGEWVVDANATCGADGKQHRTCSVCGETETQTIPATGAHSFGGWIVDKQPSCGITGNQHRTCSVCGKTENQTIQALKHNYNSMITRQPTCTNPGEMTYTCTLCSDHYTESIPVVDHKWEDVYETKWIGYYQCKKCGFETEDANEIGNHIFECDSTYTTLKRQENILVGHKCKDCGQTDY